MNEKAQQKEPKGIFLDKDIIFRFARLKVFKEGLLFKQSEVMRLIHEGKLKAFISNNTPFSVINHLIYKYVRLDQTKSEELRKEAESKAKEWFEDVLCCPDLMSSLGFMLVFSPFMLFP